MPHLSGIMTSGRLWHYYWDEIDDADDNAPDGNSFRYKVEIVGKTSKRPARPGHEGDANLPPHTSSTTNFKC